MSNIKCTDLRERKIRLTKREHPLSREWQYFCEGGTEANVTSGVLLLMIFK